MDTTLIMLLQLGEYIHSQIKQIKLELLEKKEIITAIGTKGYGIYMD